MSDSTPNPDAEVTEVEPAVAQRWLEAGEAILIDVRETLEYEHEHVPGSLLHPLSFLDPDVFPKIPQMRLVLLCQAGKRSIAAGLQLQKAGFSDLVSLAGGIEAWRKAGFDVEGAKYEAHDYVI